MLFISNSAKRGHTPGQKGGKKEALVNYSVARYVVIIITDITFTLKTLARIVMSVKIMSVALRSGNNKVR